MRLSVIIPSLTLPDDLEDRLALFAGNREIEILIICPEGSGPASLPYAAIASGPLGRGQQLAKGGALAKGKWLLFLHDDVTLDDACLAAAFDFIAKDPSGTAHRAGYFMLAYQSPAWQAKVVAWLANLRSHRWGLPYGDQGLLIGADYYRAVGGYADLALMEDVDMVRRLGAKNLHCLGPSLKTTSPRHEAEGWLRRGWRNLGMLRDFRKGVPLDEIKQRYG